MSKARGISMKSHTGYDREIEVKREGGNGKSELVKRQKRGEMKDYQDSIENAAGRTMGEDKGSKGRSRRKTCREKRRKQKSKSEKLRWECRKSVNESIRNEYRETRGMPMKKRRSHGKKTKI
jgi:hypothetical protein